MSPAHIALNTEQILDLQRLFPYHAAKSAMRLPSKVERLPLEILSMAADYLHADQDYKSLLAVQSCSKAHYKMATPRTYHTIPISEDTFTPIFSPTTYPDLEEDPTAVFGFTSLSAKKDRRLGALRHTKKVVILSAPSLKVLARHIALMPKPNVGRVILPGLKTIVLDVVLREKQIARYKFLCRFIKLALNEERPVDMNLQLHPYSVAAVNEQRFYNCLSRLNISVVYYNLYGSGFPTLMLKANARHVMHFHRGTDHYQTQPFIVSFNALAPQIREYISNPRSSPLDLSLVYDNDTLLQHNLPYRDMGRGYKVRVKPHTSPLSSILETLHRLIHKDFDRHTPVDDKGVKIVDHATEVYSIDDWLHPAQHGRVFNGEK